MNCILVLNTLKKKNGQISGVYSQNYHHKRLTDKEKWSCIEQEKRNSMQRNAKCIPYDATFHVGIKFYYINHLRHAIRNLKTLVNIIEKEANKK